MNCVVIIYFNLENNIGNIVPIAYSYATNYKHAFVKSTLEAQCRTFNNVPLHFENLHNLIKAH